jgi:hypothetical protein
MRIEKKDENDDRGRATLGRPFSVRVDHGAPTESPLRFWMSGDPTDKYAGTEGSAMERSLYSTEGTRRGPSKSQFISCTRGTDRGR